MQSNNSWPFSYKIGNAYLCCYSLSLSIFYFIRSRFSPPQPAMPVMNLNYGKVTFHSVDLSVVLFELAVLPHYYGILIDSLNPLQTRATKMWERYWLSSNFGWQNWQRLFIDKVIALSLPLHAWMIRDGIFPIPQTRTGCPVTFIFVDLNFRIYSFRFECI